MTSKLTRSLIGSAVAVLLALSGTGRAESIYPESKATLEQYYGLNGIDRVVVECYCPKHRVQRSEKRKTLRLVSVGNFSVVGYHGSRENAGVDDDPRNRLRFTASRKERTLWLRSSERTYIHHELVVVDLLVDVPPGPAVEFRKLEYDELEGRL